MKTDIVSEVTYRASKIKSLDKRAKRLSSKATTNIHSESGVAYSQFQTKIGQERRQLCRGIKKEFLF